jgi:uncharacterized protein YecT (DUF1311 family)
MYNLKNLRMKLIFGLMFLLFFKVNSQNFSNDLKIIERKNQECLDKGRYMSNCSEKYYHENDSLLNVVYNRIKISLSSEDKINLKKTQIEWLRLRDKEFKEINSKNTGLGNGLDYKMLKNQEKANFVAKRIEYLLSQFLPKESE